MIGCYLALTRGLITDVVYFHDLTEERVAEAARSAEFFGFKPWFSSPFMGDWVDMPPELDRLISEIDTIWCPSSKDLHPHHASANLRARRYAAQRGCKLIFYTVDMNSFQEPLPPDVRKSKKAVLENLFPSQASLFQNEKYFLFEGYSERDHTISRTWKLGEVSVTIKGADPMIPKEILKPGCDELDETYLNRLIVEYYNRGSVSMISVTRDNTTVEFNG